MLQLCRPPIRTSRSTLLQEFRQLGPDQPNTPFLRGAAFLRGVALGLKLVAQSAYGDDAHRTGWVIFNLCAQPFDVHVAKIARLRFPEVAVPPQVADQFVEMSKIADSMIGKAEKTLADRDAEAAESLASEDSKMDDLRRDQFRLLLGDDWTYGVESAVDTALLGRYYERIADHAVAVGSRVIYIVTGEGPAGEDWPSAY